MKRKLPLIGRTGPRTLALPPSRTQWTSIVPAAARPEEGPMRRSKRTVTMVATVVGAAVVLGASTAAPASAAPQQTAATSPKVPACLVGRFTEMRAVSDGTFTFNGQRLHLVGAKGEVFVQQPSGASYDDYQHAGPLTGTYGGSTITLTFRGRITHQLLSATSSALRERDIARSMRGSFVWRGQHYAFNFGSLSLRPYTVRVHCTARGFTDAGSAGSDSYTRAGASSQQLRAQAVTAEGGSSIATAPPLAWGQVQYGVGGDNFESQGYNASNRGQTFWRVRVFAGDIIRGHDTVSSTNGCGTNRMELFAPTVSDATLANSTPTFNTGTEGGTTNTCGPDRTEQWRWSPVPYTGLATIWAGISREAPTFSFVATVAHRVTLRIASVPHIVRAGSSITVHARASSLAGVPTGSCTFAERAGTGRWVTITQALVHKGSCAGRITISATSHVRVSFVSHGPWQPATTSSALIRAA